jgi:hypothetical protein
LDACKYDKQKFLWHAGGGGRLGGCGGSAEPIRVHTGYVRVDDSIRQPVGNMQVATRERAGGLPAAAKLFVILFSTKLAMPPGQTEWMQGELLTDGMFCREKWRQAMLNCVSHNFW